MNEEQTRRLPDITELFIATTVKFQALADSARIQFDLISQSQHSQIISRIGFVMQEIMDLEREISEDIENRAIQINSNDTECILDAQRGLHSSLVVAGDLIRYASMELHGEISLNNKELVYPALETIDAIVSQLKTEMFEKLGYLNAVTQMDFLLELLMIQVEIGESIFEWYVDKIITDFIALEVRSSDMNASIYPRLDRTLEDFRFRGNVIRNSLVNCN